jgi:outer membrane protein TolC
MRKFLSSIILIGVLFTSYAQESKSLSIEEAVELASKNNQRILQSSAQTQIAKAEYIQSSAAFLPSIDFSLSGIKTNDPLASFGFKLKQEIVQQTDFSPSLLNDPLIMNHYSMKFELQLPILNMDGFYQRKASKLAYESAQLQNERNLKFIQFQTKSSYFQLALSYEVIKVVNESLISAKAALTLSENNFEQGLIKEADVLLAKVHLSDLTNKLKEAKNRSESSKEHLLNLIGLSTNLELKLSSTLITESGSTDFDLSDLSIHQRSDIKAYSKGVDARMQLQKASSMKFMPRINAFGSNEWNDDKILGTQATNYSLGAILSWKLFNGQKNIGGIKKAKAELAYAQHSYSNYLSESELELKKALRDLSLKFETITTNKLNLAYALESKRMIKNRYEQGLEKTIDLLYAENLASNRKLNYLQSKYNYQIQKYYLELLLEKELENL